MSRRVTCVERQVFSKRTRPVSHSCETHPGLRSALYRVYSQDERVRVRDLLAFGRRADNLGTLVTWQIGPTKAVISKRSLAMPGHYGPADCAQCMCSKRSWGRRGNLTPSHSSSQLVVL